MYFYALTEELAAPTVVFRDFGPYLELGDTVVRDIGQIATSGFSSGFSSGFGPSLGDNILAFGTTITRDMVVSKEPLFTTTASYIALIDESSTTIIVSAGPTVTLEWQRTVRSNDAFVPVEWRGVFARDAQVPIEWRGLMTSDVTIPDEWGLSARNDAVASIDFNMTRLASPVVPAEWGGTTLFCDTTMPLEFATTTALSWPAPAEWQSRIFAVAPVPVNWIAPFLNDSIMPMESKSSALSDTTDPIDFGQPAQMSTNFTVPLEFISQISLSYDEPLAIGQVRARDATIPAEWTGNTGVALFADVPLEWRGVFTTDSTAPVEWRGSMMQNASSVIEWGFGLNVTPVVAVEFSSIILGESFIVPDADAGIRTEDVTASSETGASPSRDIVVPLASSGSATGVTGDATVSLSFSGGVGSTIYPIAMELGVSSAGDTAIPVGNLAAMLSEPETVAESTLTVIGESFVFPDTNFDLITADYATPVEWSATGISASVTFEFGYVSNVVMDVDFSMDWYGTSLSADTLSLIDWTQDTASLVGDASMPISWVVQILVDETIVTEEGFGRKSIGAGLEPDEWERERD